MQISSISHSLRAPQIDSTPPPQQEPPEEPPSDTFEAGRLVRHATRWGLAAVGGALGAAAGAAAGAVVGGALGAVIGYQGQPSLEFEFLKPLSNVAGMGGSYVHGKAEKLGKWPARILGASAGLVTGAAIGTAGMAWAGLDLGARQGLKLVDPPPKGPDTDPRKTYERGWGPQLPTPDGEIKQNQHHFLYNRAALQTLAHDAQNDPEMAEINTLFESDPEYAQMLQMGGWNLDTFLGNPLPGVSPSTFHHFTEPFWPGFKSAEWQCRQAYDRASDAWKEGDRKLAVYYLGAAVHLVQDVSLPQHAVGEVTYVGKMLGHQMMEGWSESQFARMGPAPSEGGLYIDASTPEEYVAAVSAESAAEYKGAVTDALRYVKHRRAKADQGLPTDHANQTDFDSEPYANTLDRAVRHTPGFFRMFFRDMAAQGFPINPGSAPGAQEQSEKPPAPK